MAPNPSASPLQWPDSLRNTGSKNALRILNRSWDNTPLGPITTWPQSLRTNLITCLESSFPTFLFWSPALVVFYNDAGIPVLGEKGATTALGMLSQDVVPELWDLLQPMFEYVLREGKSMYLEDQRLVMDRSGFTEETFMTWSYSPIRNESGGVGGIFSIVMETTKKNVFERRMKMLREMALATPKISSLQDAYDACMHVLATNPYDVPVSVLRIIDKLGRARTVGTIGISVPDRALDPAAPSHSPQLHKVLTTRAPILFNGMPDDVTYLPSQDGVARPRQIYIVPVMAPADSRILGFLSVGISPHRPFDCDYAAFLQMLGNHIGGAIATAEVRLEASQAKAVLNDMTQITEELAKVGRAKTAFFSNVSHEFRTPLTLLLGPVEEALARAGSTVTMPRDTMASVHRNATRLLKLVNSLLDFSRAEMGRLQATYQATDLGPYTAHLVSQFDSLLQRGGLTLEVHVQDGLEPVYVDRSMWEKVIFNFLSNAFKFTLEGGITVTIKDDNDAVAMCVADTGCGIPEEHLPWVFERFHCIPGTKSRSIEGSGIGLALVKEFVEQHHGTVSVASQVGRGTAFTVRILKGTEHLNSANVQRESETLAPAHKTSAYLIEASRWLPSDRETPPRRPDDAPKEGAGDDKARPTVLVVDDNADMRAHLRDILSPLYNVRLAARAEDALQTIANQLPDLVLSDVMMHGMGGFDLLQHLRRDTRTGAIPFILLSARAGADATVEGLEAGADDYLVKPFSAQELLARVHTQLHMAKLRHDLDVERETRAAREQVRRLNADLTRAVRTRDQFLSIASHELKTPITSLKLQLQMRARALTKGTAFPEERLQKIFADDLLQIDRLTRLVDDMLDISKINAGKLELKCIDVELGTLVSNVIDRFALQLQTTATSVAVCAPGPIIGHWDRFRVEQIVTNLLTNAIKYGRGQPVNIILERRGNDAVIMVRDHGMGIANTDHKRIFRQFERAVSANEVSGLGLGLYIVKQIVEAHHGTVGVDSEIGKGATFEVCLPLAADA